MLENALFFITDQYQLCYTVLSVVNTTTLKAKQPIKTEHIGFLFC